MRIITQKYYQNDQVFYSAVIPFSEVYRTSKVLVYGDSEYGYQRAPIKRHYQNIKKSILSKKDSLPTSIILSINTTDISEYLKPVSLKGSEDSKNENEDSKLYELNLTEIPNGTFRIVDGQHRLEGLSEASEQDGSFNNFLLNVIIIAIDENERYKEILLFRDINSKAKKLKTDLTLLAMYNYELINKQKINSDEDMINHLLIRTVYFLNEKHNSVWKEAVQFDIHEQPIQGIIGVAAMTSSLESLIKKYIENCSDNLTLNDSSEVLIKNLNENAEKISEILISAWNRVERKWSKCFESKDKLLTGEPRYKKSYYLQKTTGVNAIHAILEENIVFSQNDIMLNKFFDVIDNSSVEDDDWYVGGKMSGLTSKSGFSKAKKIIEIGFVNYEKEQEDKRKLIEERKNSSN